jgi:hypothetical protein
LKLDDLVKSSPAFRGTRRAKPPEGGILGGYAAATKVKRNAADGLFTKPSNLKCGSLRGIIHGTRKHFKKGTTMRLNTIQRKNARRGFEPTVEKEERVNRM